MKKEKKKTSPADEQTSDPHEEDAGKVEDAQELSLEEDYARVCAELEDQKQMSLRILADTENLKKRLVREKDEFCKFATSGVVENILPVLDNLELALQHGRKEEACKNLVQGVEMTLDMFKEILQKNGLTIIGQDHVGTPFDPAFHEAMSQAPDPTMEAGCVSQVLQTGYKLHDRLIRPAKVVVSKQCDPEAL
jgi:molecular chaperone GrpE